MSKLNKLKLSGTTYELQDLSAQPLLSAGTGIQISGNVISCTGGGGGNPTVELTQAEYDALVSAGTVSQNTYYIITDAQEIDTTNYWTSAQTQSAITDAVSGKADTTAVTQSLAAKQDVLVSGTNIKTVNNESLLGSGNITIQGGGKAIEGGRGITVTTGETADTVSFNLPISAGTSNGVIIGSGSASYNGLVHGIASTANGIYSNVFAYISTGSGNYSITAGGYLQNPKEFGAAFGQYNTTSPYNPIFSVGNGTSNSNRHNAFQILDNGDIYISSGGTDIKLQDNLGGGTVDTSLDSGSTNPVANSAITTALSGKQDTLVSGTNIKTINNESLLGSGNITIGGGGTINIDSNLDSGSTNAVANSAITAAIDAKQDTLIAGSGITIDSANTISCTIQGGMTEDDELLIATALTDLNDRKIDASEVKANYQKKGDYVTTSTLNTRLANYETVLDEQNVEEVTAYALNDLNNRVSDNTTALGGLKLVKITQSQYTALQTKDENTLYVVIADTNE